jgi:hypothetical protein
MRKLGIWRPNEENVHMNARLRITSHVLLAATVFVFSGCAANRKSEASASALDGKWQGTLTVSQAPIHGGEWNWHPGNSVRLELSGNRASVAIDKKGRWEDVSRSFSVVSRDTNAVVTSIESGEDKDGVWIETWTFCITKLDATHLEATWHRQVNNKMLPRNSRDAVFDIFGYGELTPVGH